MKNIKLWTVTWILIQNWAYWQRLQQTDCRLSCWPLWGTLTRLGKQSRYLYSATCVPAWTSSQTALPILSWAFWCCSQGPWASLRSPWLLECEYSPALWIPFFFFSDLMKILDLCLIQDSLRYSSFLLLFCAFVKQSVITVFPPHPFLFLLEDYVIFVITGIPGPKGHVELVPTSPKKPCGQVGLHFWGDRPSLSVLIFPFRARGSRNLRHSTF